MDWLASDDKEMRKAMMGRNGEFVRYGKDWIARPFRGNFVEIQVFDDDDCVA